MSRTSLRRRCWGSNCDTSGIVGQTSATMGRRSAAPGRQESLSPFYDYDYEIGPNRTYPWKV